MTAARSASESCFHGGIAVPGLPFSTSAICSAFGPLTIFEPSSAGKAPGTPLPFGWWHAAQLAVKIRSPVTTEVGFELHTLFGSPPATAIFAFCSSDPLGVIFLRLHLDDDRHEAVLLAAELGALAAIDARPSRP